MQFRFIILLFSVLLFSPNDAESRVGTSACESALRQKRFTFYAQWANSQHGDRNQLNPPYELTVTAGLVKVYLPFYGRIYKVPSPEELRFMSIDLTFFSFGYSLSQSKKRNWTLDITPNDHRDVRSLSFTITRDCYCSLWVHSAGRTPMVYDGFIEPSP
jgi:hypothetical protein